MNKHSNNRRPRLIARLTARLGAPLAGLALLVAGASAQAGVDVRAPFTHVGVGHRGVDVRAPFTHVGVDPRHVGVSAPFTHVGVGADHDARGSYHGYDRYEHSRRDDHRYYGHPSYRHDPHGHYEREHYGHHYPDHGRRW